MELAMLFNIDEVLAMAQQIERNGANFYRQAADIAKEADVKELLAKLAEWEAGHEQLFSRIRGELADKQSSPTVDPDSEAEYYLRFMADEHVFGPGSKPAKILAGCQGSNDIIDVALAFEKDTIMFFVAMKNAMPSSDMVPHVERLIREEFEHIAYLHKKRRG